MNWRRIKRYSAVLLTVAYTASISLGCGTEAGGAKPEDVALIEPVGVEESFETVRRRNLYDYKVYDGIVCPYTEELRLKRDMYFDEYSVLPGEWVKKGQTIIKADTEKLDEQIADMRKKMAEDQESYQEYLEENQESLEKLRGEESFWGGAVERWQKQKPEQYITNPATGAAEPNPQYESWAAENERNGYERKYRNALIGRQKLEAALEQKEELYQLDLEHQQLLLKRLETQRAECNLPADMPGYVANVIIKSRGYYTPSGVSMAAVADPDRRLLKTDYINNQEIRAAEQLFAVVDGKRYEVEYEAMDSAEYKRLSEANGKVYSTFYLPEELKDVDLGTYVAVVMIRKSRPEALTVSKQAVAAGEDGSYVYALRDGERIYTPVKTGIQDGLYVEILSGLEEGDLVVTEETPPKEGKTQKLVMGSVSHETTKKADFTYFSQENIINPVKHGNVYFEGITVQGMEQVKKGDVLVRLRVEPDGDELQRLERALLREQERAADLRKQDEEKNAKAIKAREKTIAELEKQIAEVKADYATTEIRAPYDGIILYFNWDLWNNSLKAGDLISPEYMFLTMASTDSNYLTVEDEEGILSFGNSAVVEYTDQEGAVKTVEGQVVSLNLRSVSRNLLMSDTSELVGSNYGESTVHALIRIPPESMQDFVSGYMMNAGWQNSSKYKVTVTTRKMDNVLLIPKRAVVSYSGSTYAKLKLEDGTIMYQGFVAGGSDSENYWVVEGLTEGMEVCIE